MLAGWRNRSFIFEFVSLFSEYFQKIGSKFIFQQSNGLVIVENKMEEFSILLKWDIQHIPNLLQPMLLHQLELRRMHLLTLLQDELTEKNKSDLRISGKNQGLEYLQLPCSSGLIFTPFRVNQKCVNWPVVTVSAIPLTIWTDTTVESLSNSVIKGSVDGRKAYLTFDNGKLFRIISGIKSKFNFSMCWFDICSFRT